MSWKRCRPPGRPPISRPPTRAPRPALAGGDPDRQFRLGAEDPYPDPVRVNSSRTAVSALVGTHKGVDLTAPMGRTSSRPWTAVVSPPPARRVRKLCPWTTATASLPSMATTARTSSVAGELVHRGPEDRRSGPHRQRHRTPSPFRAPLRRRRPEPPAVPERRGGGPRGTDRREPGGRTSRSQALAW